MTDMKKSKIVITGGAGFVGSYVVEQLIDDGFENIVIVDNLFRGSRENIKESLLTGKATLIEGDIKDRNLLDNLFSGCDYCIHLAALRITHCAEHPREALETMYDGTFNVLEACVKHKVKKIIFSSTASIYGQADKFPTDELHHPYNNYTLYGAAKMANELMLRSFERMYGLPYIALRYFNIYGPRMDTFGKYTEVLIRWYRMIKEGKAPLIYGDGKQTMDFIYVGEVAKATIMALKSDCKNEVFNVAFGKETSLYELCNLLLKAMCSNLKPQFVDVPLERRKVEVFKRKADVSKAKKLLAFRAEISLGEGLTNLVKWLDSLEMTK